MKKATKGEQSNGRQERATYDQRKEQRPYLSTLASAMADRETEIKESERECICARARESERLLGFYSVLYYNQEFSVLGFVGLVETVYREKGGKGFGGRIST